MNGYLRERILEPILIPLAAVALIGFGALNLSRLFLASAHADRAVIVASLIAVGILGGAAWATSRERIDRGTLFAGAALLGVLLSGAGLLANEVDRDRVAGEEPAEEEDGAAVDFASEITVVAVDIDFPEKEFQATTGGIQVTYRNDGAAFHTFVFEGREEEFKLETSGGETATDVADLLADEYTFYCDVPGHRSAGMEGTLTVS